MTHDERWKLHYDQVMQFVETHRKRPSKHKPEDMAMHNWIKYTKKRYDRGLVTGIRREQFSELLEKLKEYRKYNQYH